MVFDKAGIIWAKFLSLMSHEIVGAATELLPFIWMLAFGAAFKSSRSLIFTRE